MTYRGLIGPARQFGKGGVYYGEIYALVGGALLPLLLWGWRRFHPETRLKKFNLAVALTVCTFTPPATGITYASSFVVGCISRKYSPQCFASLLVLTTFAQSRMVYPQS